MGYSTSTSGTWRKIHKNIKEKKIQKGHEYLDKAPQVQLLVAGSDSLCIWVDENHFPLQ